MRALNLLRTACLAGLLLSGCGGATEGEEARRVEGREETRKIRKADAVGYAGSAVADRLDKTLDQADRRKAQIDQTGAQTAKP
jgi:hypothetical protein